MTPPPRRAQPTTPRLACRTAPTPPSPRPRPSRRLWMRRRRRRSRASQRHRVTSQLTHAQATAIPERVLGGAARVTRRTRLRLAPPPPAELALLQNSTNPPRYRRRRMSWRRQRRSFKRRMGDEATAELGSQTRSWPRRRRRCGGGERGEEQEGTAPTARPPPLPPPPLPLLPHGCRSPPATVTRDVTGCSR